MSLAIRALLLLCALGVSAGNGATAREALVIPIDGAIGTATAELVIGGIEQAREQDAALLILRMDTPGGLDQAMRAIIKAILASEVPVVGYVAPSGARAASAGTYILYAGHVAAMAPATNLGAATPVAVGGLPGIGGTGERGDGADEAKDDDSGGAMKRKLVNDAVAYIRGLADLRDRNADWAEQAVRESVSLASAAALERQVIDLVAADIPELLERIDGRSVSLPNGERTLNTADLPVRELQPGWRVRLLSAITNPNVAYILLMIGIYGLIFELSNPGAVVPGVIGGVSLLLALYALQLLPVNYAGLALILLGMALMAAEAFVPSFGVLGVGGLAAFLFGSVILMDDGAVVVGPSLAVIGAAGALSAGFFFWVLGRLLSLRRRGSVTGVQGLSGRIAEAREDFTSEGRVHVQGEDWLARSSRPVRRGERLRITGVHGLRLDVDPEEPE